MSRSPAALAVLVAVAATLAPRPSRADEPADEPAAEPAVRRVALLVGADDGGGGRVRLRYAGTDAARVAQVVRELGGVAPADALLVRSSHRAAVVAGLDRAAGLVDAARRTGARTELLVFYSGHSDEEGLLLGGERMSYRELRDRIIAIPSDVHVAVLDSCASGAFTRLKGGAARPSFLLDAATRVTGYAYISSSSADEAAQESDRIAGSYFTHAFTSGLRGGADANRDGKVTLNEAYQFAFAETVARTESTLAGAQHPAYDLHLVGTGDVVMTDLRATSATLVLAAALDGRVFVRDATGVVVVELAKSSGRPVQLGLAPGRYELTLRIGARRMLAGVTLAAGRSLEVGPAEFRLTELEVAVARGGGEVDLPEHDVAFALSLLPPLGTYSIADRPRKRFSLNVLVGETSSVDGVEIGGLINYAMRDVRGVEVAGLANLVKRDVRGVQLAGLGNVTGRRVRGVEIAGLVNATGAVEGAQLAGVVNYTVGHAAAVQVAGITNVVRGGADGAQLAGVANYDPSGGRGLRAAGIVNVTGALRGAQLAGALNIASSVDAQVAPVNIAGQVRGVQVGVVNVARESDVSIGLLNLVGNGYHALDGWVSSDKAAANLGLKLGARRTYTLLSMSSSPFSISSTPDRYQVGAGLGVHLPMARSYVDVDLSDFVTFGHGFDRDDHAMLTQLRAMFGWNLGEGLAVFAGAQLTAGFAFDGADVDEPSPFVVKTIEGDDVTVRLAPGVFVGLATRL